MKYQKIAMLCLIPYLLTGCIVQKRPLESLGLATAIGLDKGRGTKVDGTIVLHHFGTKPEDVAQQLTSTADTSKGLFKYMNLETSDRLVTGQLRVAVYGKEYAHTYGIQRQVETLKRDAATQTDMYLAISKTTAKDILYLPPDQEHTKNMGTYLYKMIQQNIEGDNMISCTVQEYLRDYYQVGKDPVLPLLEKRKDFVLIDGSMLMYRGKSVREMNARDTFYVKLLRDGYKGLGQMDLELPKKAFQDFYTGKVTKYPLYMNLQQIKAKTKIKLVKQKDPVFDVTVKMKANISTLNQAIDLGQPKVYEKFEKEINKVVKKEVEKVIAKVQDTKVDPMGFGAIYDTSIRHLTLTEKDWYESLYPRAKFRVHVDMTIARSGVLN